MTDVDSSFPAHGRLPEGHDLARALLMDERSVADRHPALTRVVRAPGAAP